MKLSAKEWFAFAGLVTLGIFFRGWDLARAPMWVDEAESSLNALSILIHGVPTGNYLGLPIYENTLTIFSPGSTEYEFRDSSYSVTGLATYHSWLPLYSIALSLRLFGVRPDQNVSGVQHDAAARRLRTIAGRVPAVVFGGVCLIALFFCGLSFFGRDAAWAALVAGVVSSSHIDIDRQARYYSATVTLSVICCLFAWRALRTREWRHYLWAALPFTLLFHTHLLTFLAAAVTFGLAALVDLRQDWRSLWKPCAFGAIVGAFTLPWILITGFLRQGTHIPLTWRLLTLPKDLLLYPLERPAHAAFFGVGALGVAALFWHREALDDHFRAHLRALMPALLFLGTLMLVGFLGFLLCVPAASFFFGRLSLSLFGPGVLLAALLCSIAARWAWERHAVWIAPLLMLLFLACADRLQPVISAETGKAQWSDLNTAISYLDQHGITPRTRIYATPNDHLTLTFYTGLPVQSVAPVRREFLSEYPGEIVFLERRQPPAPEHSALGWRRIQAVFHTNEQEARRLSELYSSQDLRQSLAGHVRTVDPPLTPIPELALPLLEEYRKELYVRAYRLADESAKLPIFRGYQIRSWTDWWQVFFYRFVDPDARRGDHANYAARLLNARARLLPDSTWIAYESPGTGER